MSFRFATITLLVVALVSLTGLKGLAQENVVGRPTEAPAPAASVAEVGPPSERMLTSPDQLSPFIRASVDLPDSAVAPAATGEGGHPFTTQRASAVGSIHPVDLVPWRASGKLHMRFGSATYVCTASVIEDSILVTAAHCVHMFGEEGGGFADAVTFEPARHVNERPYGTWTAREWWIPGVYYDGTDVCSPDAPGVVCENDVAVVVLEENEEGEQIGDVVGRYAISNDDEFGYVDFLNQRAAQFTQLGYPSAGFDGDKLIRTDSLGYQDHPYNVIIGSNQTGGASGGAWIQNFGTPTTATTSQPQDAQPNVVTAVTSWGYISDRVKVQGASRFSRNTAYTEVSNIRSLLESACSNNPGACSNHPSTTE